MLNEDIKGTDLCFQNTVEILLNPARLKKKKKIEVWRMGWRARARDSQCLGWQEAVEPDQDVVTTLARAQCCS